MSDFGVTLDIAPTRDTLRQIRGKVAIIRETVADAVAGPIRNTVVDTVTTTLAVYPNRAGGSFAFATERSRRWYLTARRLGLFPSQSSPDGPWERTSNLADSWKVEVNPGFNQFRGRSSTLGITNDAVDELGRPYAQAVYGPDAVPGHADTGWGDNFDSDLETIADDATNALLEALDAAIAEFVA